MEHENDYFKEGANQEVQGQNKSFDKSPVENNSRITSRSSVNLEEVIKHDDKVKHAVEDLDGQNSTLRDLDESQSDMIQYVQKHFSADLDAERETYKKEQLSGVKGALHFIGLYKPKDLSDDQLIENVLIKQVNKAIAAADSARSNCSYLKDQYSGSRTEFTNLRRNVDNVTSGIRRLEIADNRIFNELQEVYSSIDQYVEKMGEEFSSDVEELHLQAVEESHSLEDKLTDVRDRLEDRKSDLISLGGQLENYEIGMQVDKGMYDQMADYRRDCESSARDLKRVISNNDKQKAGYEILREIAVNSPSLESGKGLYQEMLTSVFKGLKVINDRRSTVDYKLPSGVAELSNKRQERYDQIKSKLSEMKYTGRMTA